MKAQAMTSSDCEVFRACGVSQLSKRVGMTRFHRDLLADVRTE